MRDRKDSRTPWGSGARDGRSESGLSRRGFLIAGSAAVGGGLLLSSCSSDSAGPSGHGQTFPTSSGGGDPVRGGTLTAGLITAGASETLNPGLIASFGGNIRANALFDRLFAIGENLENQPALALSAESNAEANVWTLKLRPDVTWHDGKPFTAADVLWTVNTWSEATNYASAYTAGLIDFKNVRKRDELTVEIPLVTPMAEFPSLLTYVNFGVIQDGTTSDSLAVRAVGTGPFKFVSFQPGARSEFEANRDYWEEGKPYVDRLVVDTSFTNETTRQNALLSGAIDLLPVALPSFARNQLGNSDYTVLVGGKTEEGGNAPAAQGNVFTMAVDQAPFDDVRVRQAMKLLIDREAIINGAYAGFGVVGNDTWGYGTKYYDSSIKPTHDVEKAKALLKAAGQEGMTVELQTSTASPGYVEAATLLAQQAKEAGVTIKIKQVPPANYYTTAGGYLTRTFGQDQGAEWPSISVAYRTYIVDGAPYNGTHWSDMSKIAPALAETDETKAADLWAEAQRQQAEEGGTIVTVNLPWLDVVSKKVHGIKATVAGSLNDFRTQDAWLPQS